MGTLNQTSPKKPGGPGKWVRSTGVEMNISDMGDTHLKNAAAMCRRNAGAANSMTCCIATSCGVDVVIDQLDVRDKLIHKAEELEAELTRRSLSKPVAVRREDVRVGDEYTFEPGLNGYGPKRTGRVVRVLVDAVDGGATPYYEVQFRSVSSQWPDVTLRGPQIEYHLRRVAS